MGERPATTKLRCPKCKSSDLALVETGTWSSEWIVKDGRLDRADGNHEPESVDRLDAKCSKCGYLWKPRGAHQIDDVVTEKPSP